MSETITLQALDLSGETLTMYLRKADGTLLNTDGDAMTESGSTGVFTATLTEPRSGLGPLAVRICAGSETADNLLYDGFLAEGSSVIDSTSTAVLDPALTQKINALTFDEGVGTLDVNVKHYRGTLQSNGDLPAKMDAVYNRLGSPSGASIAADIAGIEGGGGDNTEVLEAIESVADSVAAYAARVALEVQLRGFPNVICRNADYLEATESEIRIAIEDLTGAAITEIAGTPVASLSWLFGMGTEQDPALIAGTCTWDGDSDELVIEIAKAATAGKQTGSLTWQIGVSIGAARRWLGGGTTRLIERQF